MVRTFGVERRVDPLDLGRCGAALLPGLPHPGAGVVDEPLAQDPLGVPDLLAGDLVHDVEDQVRVVGVGVRAGPHAVGAGQVEDLAGDPGRGVHAVGDRGDRPLVGVELRPEATEHAAADDAVQLRDAVGALREPEAHHRHVEHGRVAAVVLLGAEGQDPVDRDAVAGVVAAEVLRDEVEREAVDAGRDRGVRGEHRAGAGDLEGRLEGQAGVLGELADPLEAEEAGVALVGVEDLGGGGAGEPGERTDRAHAADAEQHLLAQAVLGVAAVQAVGDGADDLAVLLHVGVEQQQRDAADLGDPDAGGQRLLRGQADLDLRDRAVLLAQQRQREAVGVEDRVGLLLPAVAGQRLAEVAVPVEQADADDRDAEVARGLEVVAGQDAETAGVLRQHRGDAELRGEVADGGRQRRLARRAALVPPLTGHVLLEVGTGRRELPEEVRVAGQLVQTGQRHGAEETDRVVTRGLPRRGVDGREEILGLGVPGPAQVACELAERVERLGQDGTDGEPTDSSHAEHPNADRLERSNLRLTRGRRDVGFGR